MPDDPDLLTPSELAHALGVSGRTARRYSDDYSAVFPGEVERTGSGEHGARRIRLIAVTHMQVAKQALSGGRVASFREALEHIRDGISIPTRPDLPAPARGMAGERDKQLDTLLEVNAELVLQVAALREEVAAIRADRLALPAPVAVDHATELAALRIELEKMRVSLHSTVEVKRPKGWLARLLRL